MTSQPYLDLSSVLAGGYHHPLLRTYQSRGRTLTKDMLMYPIFITDDPDAEIEIKSLPGQKRWGVNRLEGFLRPLVEKGLRSVILFGVPVELEKDEVGTHADSDVTPVVIALKLLSRLFPTLLLAADVCLCEYTNHGHCGVPSSYSIGGMKHAEVLAHQEKEKGKVNASGTGNGNGNTVGGHPLVFGSGSGNGSGNGIADAVKPDTPPPSTTSTGPHSIDTNALSKPDSEPPFTTPTPTPTHPTYTPIPPYLNSAPHLDPSASARRIAQVALAYAKAGAHLVAPSDMMDGRIKAMKLELIREGWANRCGIMSYSAKFASGLYGPFREAAGSAPMAGDRKCYQLPPFAKGLARRAINRDALEGADILMVKPGLPYLDIIQDCANLQPDIPTAVYQVSGEFAMIHAGAREGVYDLRVMAEETVGGFLRAGASIILTYFTPDFLDWLDAEPLPN